MGRSALQVGHTSSVAMHPGSGRRATGLRGRISETGQAYLDDHIQKIVKLVPEEESYFRQQSMKPSYLVFGFLDRYFELIDADWLIQTGTVDRESGFTAHPKYLEVAEKYGIIDIWEKRGAPDHCKKLDGQWICQ